MEGRILFSSPALSEFFKTSNFELNLKTGRVFTYLNPPEDIVPQRHYEVNKIPAQYKKRDSKEFQV